MLAGLACWLTFAELFENTKRFGTGKSWKFFVFDKSDLALSFYTPLHNSEFNTSSISHGLLGLKWRKCSGTNSSGLQKIWLVPSFQQKGVINCYDWERGGVKLAGWFTGGTFWHVGQKRSRSQAIMTCANKWVAARDRRTPRRYRFESDELSSEHHKINRIKMSKLQKFNTNNFI